MKGIYITSVAIIFIGMVLFPLLSMRKTVLPEAPFGTPSQSGDASHSETLRVYKTAEDKVVTMSVKDYVTGVVAAEMPAEYEPEALKAQAVVAYTYALYKSGLRKDEPYDVTDSHETDQAFLSEAAAKERFGNSYNDYMDKITSAVTAVEGQAITYEGRPILASCHSISGGKTESAEKIWGGSYPYLQPVESVGDVLSPGYLSELTVTEDDMKTALEGLSVTISGDAEEWFKDLVRSESGYILTLNVCETEIKGAKLRTALGLRSTNFDVSYEDGSFKFSVRGYGHGVGLSQYGAQFMALQGSTYTDILMWYYTNCTITDNKQ